MLIVLYLAATALLSVGLVAESPFTKVNLVIVAAVCFLLARFIRIERRLDKIEGVQRTSRAKRAWSWALSNRDLFVSIGWFAVFFVCFWSIWQPAWVDIIELAAVVTMPKVCR